MRVEKVAERANGEIHFRLLDEGSRPIEEVEGFLRHLAASGCSPNTLSAYAYDLLRFYSFLGEKGLGWEDFTPALSLQFLEYLRNTPSRNGKSRRLRPALVVDEGNPDGEPTYLTLIRHGKPCNCLCLLLLRVFDRFGQIERRQEPRAEERGPGLFPGLAASEAILVGDKPE